jgi:hypothetical protein
MISQAQLEKKIEEYLSKSRLFADQRGWPITPSELQAEIDRMAKHTKRPEMLSELFEALGKDPFVIAECLARPMLAERLAAGPSIVAGASPAPGSLSKLETAGSTVERIDDTTNVNKVQYKLPRVSVPRDCTDNTWTAITTLSPPDVRDLHTAVWTGSEMIVWGGGNFNNNQVNTLDTGGRYDPATDSWIPTSTTDAPIGQTFTRQSGPGAR